MSNRSKGWLRVSAIISLISALTFLVAGILIAFNIKDINQYYIRILRKVIYDISSTELMLYRASFVVSCAIYCIINIVAGIGYLKTSGVRYPNINDYNSLIVVAVVQLVFGGTLLPALIAIIIIVRNRHIYNTHESTVSQNRFDNLSARVSQINKLKNTNQISQDEYKKRLDAILEDYVNKQR